VEARSKASSLLRYLRYITDQGIMSMMGKTLSMAATLAIRMQRERRGEEMGERMIYLL